eukprot:8722507-Prorocentrum_lima.AAC.1
MTSSLVGSEMCIRDRSWLSSSKKASARMRLSSGCMRPCGNSARGDSYTCLLYTSDAADDM